MNKSTLRRR